MGAMAERTRGVRRRGRGSIRFWLASIVSILLPASALAAPEAVHVLVMIVDFADAPAPADLVYWDGVSSTVPLDIANSEIVFFTAASSTAARYADMSSGELTLTGDVIEVSIALSLAASTSPQWRGATDAAAVAQGYTLTDYDRFGYLLTFGFSGQMASGVAVGDWFWVSGTSSVSERIFNHEFGHTIDLKHSSSPSIRTS